MLSKKNKKPDMVKNMAALGIAAAAALVTLSEEEKDSLTYGYYTLDSGGRLPGEKRLVFLSDLHEKTFGEDNERLLDMIEKADPDMVLIGGDMVTCPRGTAGYRGENTLALCGRLAEKYPVYYAPGNHEQRIAGDRFRRKLEAAGVRYLDDEKADAGDNIMISGLYIEEEYYRAFRPAKMKGDYLRFHLGRTERESYNILLAHSPLFMDAYSEAGFDLVLSGHFHGGTVRLPGDVGLMTPQYQFFSNKVVGKKEKNGCSMIISSGLGTHSINIRLNDKPQVVVADIK